MIRTRFILTATVALTFAAAACGGGSKSSSTATPGAAQPSSQSGATSSAGATATSAGGGSGGGSDEVKAVTKKFADATFKGTYKLTAAPSVTGGGALENGQMVLYKQGGNRFRFDVTAVQDGKDLQIIFIETDSVSVFCLKDAGDFGAVFGVTAGQGLCFNSNTGGQNPVGSISQTFSDLENADVTVLEKSKRNIAGKDGTCFRAKDNKTAQISTECFASDGAILYAKTEGDDTSEIEATDISGSVKDSDFNPPYEVKDVPGLGGSGQ